MSKGSKQTSVRLASFDECIGCGACIAVCPTGALSLKVDSEGFRRPDLASDKCIRCGKCGRACPVVSAPQGSPPVVCFVARSADPVVRERSSSGGVFPVLAKRVLDQGGSVYGATMEFPSCSVRHIRIDDVGQIARLQGSKYVQGDAVACFPEIRDDLSAGRRVLFSGLPCQVAALRSWFGSIPTNLVLLDVICHGAPSPGVFLRYRDDMVPVDKRDDIVGFSFRDKQRGWSNTSPCWFLRKGSSQEIIPDRLFAKAFSLDLLSRPSCHRCPFRSWRSGSDITIGDHWDSASRPKEWEDETGVSSIVIRSKKGLDLWASIPKSDILARETPLENVLAGNPALIRDPHSNRCRSLFFLLLRRFPFRTSAKAALGLDWLLSLPGHLKPSELRKRFGRAKT